MRRCNFTIRAMAVVAGITLAQTAHAGMIPGAINVSPDSGNYRYAYKLYLPSDYLVKSGDFFTIYDFAGYVPGSTVQPAGWNFSPSLLGPNPPRILPNDSGLIWNLTWTYSGSDIAGAALLGVFEALSTFGPQTMDVEFASQDHRQIDGRTVGNYTSVSGPLVVEKEPDVPQAPEPASVILIGLGLPIAGLVRVMRRRAR